MTHVYCLDCDRKIILHADVRAGDQVTCSDCDSEFQVINVNPLEIDWLYDDYSDDGDVDDWEAEYEEEEDEEEEEWSHLIAKQRRIQSHEMDTSRKRSRDSFYE